MSKIRYHLRLYIVRHGESTNNALARDLSHDDYMAQRSVDPTLSPTGEGQAETAGPYVADLLAGDRRKIGDPSAPLVDDLFCSPMWRAMQTAQPIARILDHPPTVHLGIFEHGGIFMRGEDGISVGHPGADRAKIQAAFSDYLLPDDITESGWWRGDEEDLADCHARAIRLAYSLRQRADAAREAGKREHVVMVTHGTFMDALIKAILGQLPSYAVYYYHNNTGITCIDYNEGNVALRFLNRIDHLRDPETVTY